MGERMDVAVGYTATDLDGRFSTWAACCIPGPPVAFRRGGRRSARTCATSACWAALVHASLSMVRCRVPARWCSVRTGESNLGNFVCDGRWWMEAGPWLLLLMCLGCCMTRMRAAAPQRCRRLLE